MGRPRKENEIDILQRREKVAKLFAAHERPVAIATALDMHIETVRNDIKAIRKNYVKFSRQAFAVHIAQDLATYDEVIRRAMGQFVKTPDARYLQAVLTAAKQKAELLGYRAPTKIAPTTPDGTKPYSPLTELSEADLMAWARAVLDQGNGVVDVTPQGEEMEQIDGGQ